MESDELKHWIAFNKIPGIGRTQIANLEQRFGYLSEAWRASGEQLRQAGLDSRALAQVDARRPKIDPGRELERLGEMGVHALTWHDDAYPPRLKEFTDKPPVLFVRGELTPDDERSIAVVGTRRATPYGREMAQRLASDLARAGVTVVSGLARGIDGIAHRAALDADQRTIAVMGHGIDKVYPPEHSGLAGEIAENGALVTEFALGTRPNAGNFPRRNRIMAGMTLGTLVIEAPEESGALFTARFALEENREVFALPGNVLSPSSRGANKLIQDGAAKLVMSCEDILEEFNLSSAAAADGTGRADTAGRKRSRSAALRLIRRRPHRRDSPRFGPSNHHGERRSGNDGNQRTGQAGRGHELRQNHGTACTIHYGSKVTWQKIW